MHDRSLTRAPTKLRRVGTTIVIALAAILMVSGGASGSRRVVKHNAQPMESAASTMPAVTAPADLPSWAANIAQVERRAGPLTQLPDQSGATAAGTAGGVIARMQDALGTFVVEATTTDTWVFPDFPMPLSGMTVPHYFHKPDGSVGREVSTWHGNRTGFTPRPGSLAEQQLKTTGTTVVPPHLQQGSVPVGGPGKAVPHLSSVPLFCGFFGQDCCDTVIDNTIHWHATGFGEVLQNGAITYCNFPVQILMSDTITAFLPRPWGLRTAHWEQSCCGNGYASTVVSTAPVFPNNEPIDYGASSVSWITSDVLCLLGYPGCGAPLGPVNAAGPQYFWDWPRE